MLPEVGFFAEAFRRGPARSSRTTRAAASAPRGKRAEELAARPAVERLLRPRLAARAALRRAAHSSARRRTPTRSPRSTTPSTSRSSRDKRRTRWDYVLAARRATASIECLNDSDGIAAVGGRRLLRRDYGAYLALGRHREGPVGAATAELLDAADVVAFGARWMESHLNG